MNYHVAFEVEGEESSPEIAARRAWAVLTGPDAGLPVGTVKASDGEETLVDLEKLAETHPPTEEEKAANRRAAALVLARAGGAKSSNAKTAAVRGNSRQPRVAWYEFHAPGFVRKPNGDVVKATRARIAKLRAQGRLREKP